MKVQIVNNSNNEIPMYATEGAAGMDLRAWLDQTVMLYPGERKLIPTGIHIQLPIGYEAQVRPRSGLSFKNGIVVILGTIDSDYTGDVGVILINLSRQAFEIHNGDRIAQLVIAKYEQVDWEEVETLKETERGSRGIGHSGIK